MEHLINVYASKAARGSIAEFMGFMEVERQQAAGNLTQGLWLVRGAGGGGGEGRGRPRGAAAGRGGAQQLSAGAGHPPHTPTHKHL